MYWNRFGRLFRARRVGRQRLNRSAPVLLLGDNPAVLREVVGVMPDTVDVVE